MEEQVLDIGVEEEDEEELIRSLFLPRSESIGDMTLEDIGSFDEDENENVEECRSTLTNSGLRSAEVVLKNAERDFLKSNQVRSANVSLEDIAQRFSAAKMPEEQTEVNDYLESFVTNAVKDSVNTASPTMIGHMTSSLPYYARPLSRLVTSMNQNCVKTETANTMTFLERQAVAQLHEKFYKMSPDFYDEMAQNPNHVLGTFASGGTLANVTALWVARNMALQPTDNFAGIEKVGLFEAMSYYGYTGMTIIGSALLHYSISKAADILGVGVQNLRLVPYDEHYKIDVNKVVEAIEECRVKRILVIAIIGIAGATETGTIDDLTRLADVADQHNIYFHVDAAWGGPCVFSRMHASLLTDIDRADSITVDGHKQLYMPMGCGLCLFKDPKSCLFIQKTAKYIIRKDSYDTGKFTLEGSRPANAVFLHSNLNIFGVRGYEILVNRSIRMIRYMQSKLAAPWFEIVTKPVLNILLYRCIPRKFHGLDKLSEADQQEISDFNVKVQSVQTFQGRTFVSRTTIFSPLHQCPIVVLRVVIANPLTFEMDINRVIQNQIEIMSSLEQLPLEVYPQLCARVSVEGQSSHNTDPQYWDRYWKQTPAAVKKLFKNDKKAFLKSLVAPELGVEDEMGLFSKDRH